MFLIKGILIGSTMQDLNAAEAVFDSYADGVARTLVDPAAEPGRTSSTAANSSLICADPTPPPPAGHCRTRQFFDGLYLT